MNCQDVKPELVAYLDNELDPGLRAEVEAHLESCETCRAERDAYSATLETVDRLAAPQLTPAFKQRFWREFDEVGQRASRSWLTRPLTLAGASLAAGVLVAVLLLVPGGQPQGTKEDQVIASHLELFSDYEAIANLDMLEDFEFIEAWDDEV